MRRYGEMARNLGIARNVLAARLKALVADGLLERRRYRRDPDWYEYVLTESGRDLYGTVLAMLHWADRHVPASGDRRLRLRHLPCGGHTHAEVVCGVCGKALDPREVEAEVVAATGWLPPVNYFARLELSMRRVRSPVLPLAASAETRVPAGPSEQSHTPRALERPR